jgi:hypothetical protein
LAIDRNGGHAEDARGLETSMAPNDKATAIRDGDGCSPALRFYDLGEELDLRGGVPIGVARVADYGLYWCEAVMGAIDRDAVCHNFIHVFPQAFGTFCFFCEA